MPAAGEIGIFNRSHYEDVLIVRVHEFVPRDVWMQRYDQIREFEQVLAQTGPDDRQVLPVHRQGRATRGASRSASTTPRSVGSSRSATPRRKYWNDYIGAYEDALNKTSTDYAPWYVIPAIHNWFRNLAVSSILADTIDDLKPAYPPAPDLPKDLVIIVATSGGGRSTRRTRRARRC